MQNGEEKLEDVVFEETVEAKEEPHDDVFSYEEKMKEETKIEYKKEEIPSEDISFETKSNEKKQYSRSEERRVGKECSL